MWAAVSMVATAIAAGALPVVPATACENPKTSIGIARVVEIDTRNGPLFGKATSFNHQPSFLADKEVVLTFDDGPAPDTTAAVLAALSRHCTRATFFPVGRQAVRHPGTMRAIAEAGHTIGSHTWSHPKNLGGLPVGEARDEIERGFAAVAVAARHPIAPFFRFTGLNDDRELLTYLQIRRVATFTVDVITDDSFTSDTSKLVRNTLERTRSNNGGILLFHDLKKVTARALPIILSELKSAGFKVVHLVPSEPFRRDTGYDSQFARYLRSAARVDRSSPPASTGSIGDPAASIEKSAVGAGTPAAPKITADPALAALPRTRLIAEQALFDGTERPLQPDPQPAQVADQNAGDSEPAKTRPWWQNLPVLSWPGGLN